MQKKGINSIAIMTIVVKRSRILGKSNMYFYKFRNQARVLWSIFSQAIDEYLSKPINANWLTINTGTGHYEV